MRFVVQRVARARVLTHGEVVGEIGLGVLALVGVERGDSEALVPAAARKLMELRIFENEKGKFDRSVRDVGGSVLLVSQFTLFGDVSRGRRPSFDRAERRERAEFLLNCLETELRKLEVPVATGRFGAQMEIELVNVGPVTLVFDVSSVPSRAGAL